MIHLSSLYFIGAEGLEFIKVGRSKNPQGRLRQLRTGSPYKLSLVAVYEGAGELEPFVLRLLRCQGETQGEWFFSRGLNLDKLVSEARDAQLAPPPPVVRKVTNPTRTGAGLGARITRARLAQGLQQKTLCELTGLSQKYMSEIELDKVDPRFSIVQRIARALGVSMALLNQEQCDA